MLHSMTSFARVEREGRWGRLVLELRSVNHRYLDLSFKLPEDCRRFEAEIRTHIQGRLARGKVDCLLKVAPPEHGDGSLMLNESLVDELITLAVQVDRHLAEPSEVRALDLLRWPGVVVASEVDAADLKPALMEALGDCLDELLAVRRNEGARLATFITDRSEQARGLARSLAQDVPSIVRRLLDRFQAKIADLGVEVEPNRLEQECALLAQRLDIAEEIDRLIAHLDEVDQVIAKGGPCGRRLDFLMQELNREANTLGSKSAHLETTSAAVDLKVLIEQMREQVQNVE